MGNEETQQKDKKDIQLEVDKQPQLIRRILMIVIGVILALSMATVTFYSLSTWQNCPYTMRDCVRPEVSSYWDWFSFNCIHCD